MFPSGTPLTSTVNTVWEDMKTARYHFSGPTERVSHLAASGMCPTSGCLLFIFEPSVLVPRRRRDRPGYVLSWMCLSLTPCGHGPG
jgi:hypothetical protein